MSVAAPSAPSQFPRLLVLEAFTQFGTRALSSFLRLYLQMVDVCIYFYLATIDRIVCSLTVDRARYARGEACRSTSRIPKRTAWRGS